MDAKDLSFEEIEIGREAGFAFRISEQDLAAFIDLSGDSNPLHADSEYARANGQPDRVVHGAFLAALASRLVGMELPGRRSLLLGFKLDFALPVFPGDEVKVRGVVKSLHPAHKVVVIKIRFTRGDETVARGTATVSVRE